MTTTTPNDAVGGRKMEETSGAESARKGPTAFLTATQHSAGDVCSIYRLRFLGKRQKARLLAYPRVLIRSDNGFWRANRCGYTSFEGAAVYEGADAYAATRHCGPEKEVTYYLLRPAESGDAVARSASAGNEGEAEVLRDDPQHLEARIRELEAQVEGCRGALEEIVALFGFEYPAPLQAEAVARQALALLKEPGNGK